MIEVLYTIVVQVKSGALRKTRSLFHAHNIPMRNHAKVRKDDTFYNQNGKFGYGTNKISQSRMVASVKKTCICAFI